ncbi:hypothetical protein [Nocardia aurea]
MNEPTEITVNDGDGDRIGPVVVWPDPSPLSTWWEQVMGPTADRSLDV